MPEFTITMKLKDQPEIKHEVHIVAETFEQAIKSVKERYKDTIYEVDPTSMGLSLEINGAGGPMRPVQPSHKKGFLFEIGEIVIPTLDPFLLPGAKEVKICNIKERQKRDRRIIYTVSCFGDGPSVRDFDEQFLIRPPSLFERTSPKSATSGSPSSSTNGYQYKALKSQFEKAKKEKWSREVSSGFIATEVDWVNEEHVHLKDGRILLITSLNRRELEEAAKAIGISPSMDNPNNSITWKYNRYGHVEVWKGTEMSGEADLYIQVDYDVDHFFELLGMKTSDVGIDDWDTAEDPGYFSQRSG